MARDHSDSREHSGDSGSSSLTDLDFSVWGASTVTTDRGRQFESHLWKAFTQLLGTKHLRTAYHPIANWLVERFHRQLKSSLRVSPHPDHWTDMLPLVLLGIRTALKEDISCTAAELVYGTSLRLPGEFFVPASDSSVDPASYVARLKSTMGVLRSTPTRQPTLPRGRVDNSLESATHVFVRHHAIKKPLQPPYDGPYQVLDRSAKFYMLDLKGRKDTVSVNRLKPAYLNHSPSLDTTPPVFDTTPPVSPATPTPPQGSSTRQTTRAGRRVHWPSRLEDFIHYSLTGVM